MQMRKSPALETNVSNLSSVNHTKKASQTVQTLVSDIVNPKVFQVSKPPSAENKNVHYLLFFNRYAPVHFRSR